MAPNSVINPKAPWPYPTHVVPAPRKPPVLKKVPTPAAASSDPIVGTLPPVDAPAPAKPSRPRASPLPSSPFLDISNMQVEEGVTPPHTARIRHKYDHLFEQMKVGANIVCDPLQVQATRKALTEWIKRTNRRGVRSYGVSQCPDGKGRVWLLSIKKSRPSKG